MKNLQIKITTIVFMAILIALIMPANVFAAEANMQVVKAESEDYIIYVEGLAETEFKFAISTKADATEGELDYINAVEDGEGNKVALIEKEKVSTGTAYIYIKNGTDVTVNGIDFLDDTQVFDIQDMKMVETTTNRIKTELLTDIEERNEIIDGIKYTQTVGGLKISEEDGAAYFYKSVKLPVEKYSDLQKYADELNSEVYTEKDMYAKIQFAKEFYSLYEQLMQETETAEVDTANGWTKVPEDMIIRQPIDAQKGDQYVVLIKKATDTNPIDDAKFLVSYREEEEEKIPGRTETVIVKETAKLPVTGDSIVLFVILAVIALSLIIVFVRMRKLEKKESKH